MVIRPHFDDYSPYPADTLFRNVRKLDDGRVCGEVNLVSDDERLSGFAVFLDPMQPGTEPVIVFSKGPPPDGYRSVAENCMNPLQRRRLDREIADEQIMATQRVNQAYAQSREALRREQGAGGYGYYGSPTVWRTRYEDAYSRPERPWRQPDWPYRRNSMTNKPITNFR